MQNLQERCAKAGDLPTISEPEQGRNRKSRPHIRDSALPAKDDVVVVLIGSSLLDHVAKTLPHLVETFAQVPPEVMGARFIAALFLRVQALASDRLHGGPIMSIACDCSRQRPA